MFEGIYFSCPLQGLPCVLPHSPLILFPNWLTNLLCNRKMNAEQWIAHFLEEFLGKQPPVLKTVKHWGLINIHKNIWQFSKCLQISNMTLQIKMTPYILWKKLEYIDVLFSFTCFQVLSVNKPALFWMIFSSHFLK